MVQVEAKFGEWLEGGFQLYKNNLGVLILGGLLAILISTISFGILAGPMMAGLVLITLRLFDKNAAVPSAGDLFEGFTFFLPSFLFVLVWFFISLAASLVLNAVPCIGQLASLAFSLALGTALMFGMYFIVDKGMEFWPASKASFELVKENFMPFLGLYVVASIVASLGAILCGIGIFLTVPLLPCILTVAFRDVAGERPPASGMVTAEDEQPGPPAAG